MSAADREPKRVTTRARARVLLEISLSQPWGGECRLDQVYRQGADQVGQIVRKMTDAARERVRLVAEPVVEAVIVLGRSEPSEDEFLTTIAPTGDRDREWREAGFETFKAAGVDLEALGFANADPVCPADVKTFLEKLTPSPCDGRCDISLARRQVGPDAVVPGNARECAVLWEQEAARLSSELARVRAEHEGGS